MVISTITTDRSQPGRSDSKPFLRWVGGKTWLARSFASHFNVKIKGRYYEPFLGSGALFFQINPKLAHLSDANNDLIETYKAVRDAPREVISTLRTYRNTEDFYYELRGSAPEGSTEKAARFIFLNRTSYNGIYRVNLKGVYNVPYGGVGKTFLDPSAILNASSTLKNVTITCQDFHKAVSQASFDDFVFLDPPYTVSHNKNGFIKYNEKLFSLDDQYRLAQSIRSLMDRDVKFVMTNANHEAIENIFSFIPAKKPLSRSSLVGGKCAKRGRTTELLFTNIDMGDA